MKTIALKAKIHRAVVTHVEVDYEGSLGLDASLLEASGLRSYEKIDVYNISNGERFSTYLIREEGGSGKVGVYGAAGHKARPGDRIIIASYALFEAGELDSHEPTILVLDEANRIKGKE